MRKIVWIGFLIVALALCGASSVKAKKSFYEGKVLVIICYAPPGGGYDFYARLLARHMPKYIPGKPRVVVKNMPGAGGIVAANYIYNQVKPNGLTIGAFSGMLHIMQTVGLPGIKYDMRKFIPLGGMQGMIYVNVNGIMRADTPYSSIEAAVQAIKQGKRPPTMATNGKGSTSYVRGRLLEEIVPGLKFKYVIGYAGSPQMALAIRKKETDGCLFGSPDSVRELLGDLYKEGKLSLLAHASPPDIDEIPGWPGVPAMWKLAKTERDNLLLKAILYKPGRPYWVPPGTPKDRVEILRTAFMKAGKDPDTIKEAKKANRPLTPTHGEVISKFEEGFFSSPPEVIRFIKETFN